ncbi:hypothetical protein MPER_08247 [Moniliophthora perniciosa FA553]|nr:hypothetical protein MPER_08247 [Moniliophthora perniciosa FA553]
MMATDDVSSSRRAEEIPLPPSPTSFSTDHEGGRQYPHEVPIPNPSIENGSNGTEGGHQVPETTLDPSGIKGEQKRVAKTTADKSWEIMMKEVTRYDEDTVKGWKEEIDTLLVFVRVFQPSVIYCGL